MCSAEPMKAKWRPTPPRSRTGNGSPLATLIDDLERRPEHYTIWFRHYLREHLAEIAPWMKGG